MKLNKHSVSFAEAIQCHVPYRPQQIVKRHKPCKNTWKSGKWYFSKRQFNLYYVKINSYTKFQVNLTKDGREKSRKLYFAKGNNSIKSTSNRDKRSTWPLLRQDKLIYEITSKCLKRWQRKVRKTEFLQRAITHVKLCQTWQSQIWS